MIFLILSFMHSIHDNLPQDFIGPIGFYCRNYVKMHDCMKLLWTFLVRCWEKWSVKDSYFPLYCKFWAIFWNCCYIWFILFSKKCYNGINLVTIHFICPFYVYSLKYLLVIWYSIYSCLWKLGQSWVKILFLPVLSTILTS